MSDVKKINICPQCKKPVEAKDFLTGLGGGAYRLGATSNWFVCGECGYRGPSVEVRLEDYKKSGKK